MGLFSKKEKQVETDIRTVNNVCDNINQVGENSEECDKIKKEHYNQKFGENIWLGDGLTFECRRIKIKTPIKTIITTIGKIDYFENKGDKYVVFINGEDIVINKQFYQWYEKVSNF